VKLITHLQLVRKVKNTRIYTSIHPYVFMTECLVSYAQGQLYLVFTIPL
jgi:hypothetical protein